MKCVRWTTEASDQFVASIERIREDNSDAAFNVAKAVLDRIEQLTRFPSLGGVGEVKGTRVDDRALRYRVSSN